MMLLNSPHVMALPSWESVPSDHRHLRAVRRSRFCPLSLHAVDPPHRQKSRPTTSRLVAVTPRRAVSVVVGGLSSSEATPSHLLPATVSLALQRRLRSSVRL